jgi:hypothetical protein
MFRSIISPLSSKSKGKPRKKPEEVGGLLLPISFSAYSSALNFEAICSSETSGRLRTTRRYNQKYLALNRYKKLCSVCTISSYTDLKILKNITHNLGDSCYQCSD